MADAAVETKKKSGMMGTILVMVGVTLIAAGGGFGVGTVLLGRIKALVPTTAPKEAPAKTVPYSGDTEVKELPPLITNLAEPQKAEIRLQASIVYSKKAVQDPTLLTAQLSEDFIAYLKTLSMAQLQGASGLQNLREDLGERAAIRSQGKVREVIIEALITR